MRVKLFLTLVAFGLITLITYNVVEADASWDANSFKKVEVSLTSKVHINKMVLAFIANFAITLVGFSLLTKKVKSLEEQLEFQEKEKLDISTHLAEVESKYAESEKCCKVSTDNTADKERNFHFENLTEVRETGSNFHCIVTSTEEMNVPEVELDFWMEKAVICQEELRSCKENNINADGILKTRAKEEKTWQKAWAKEHDYGMCVKACDLMRTAACKLAFNILPFKGYLIECP